MFRPLHLPHRLRHHLPHRFTLAHALGVTVVALVALLACGSVWSQAPAGVSPGSAFTPSAPTTSATPAPVNSGDASPMGSSPGSPARPAASASLPPTLTNPINRNPAMRVAITAPPASGSPTLASPSTLPTQGFSSPPASRDTLVAPDPSRDGAPGVL